MIRRRFELLAGQLDERTRRCVAAAEAAAIGSGGISVVARATGVSRRAVRVGLRELSEGAATGERTRGRIRRPGGGRKRSALADPDLWRDLERLMEPTTRGDAPQALRWTSKSVRQLSRELERLGHPTSHRMVAALLHEAGYSLQRKGRTLERASRPDRNAQFEHVDRQVAEFLQTKDPVISVDTRRKERSRGFKKGGRRRLAEGTPFSEARHDLADPEWGGSFGEGIPGLERSAGWASVAIDRDTASFAVETIRRWWHGMGRSLYRRAKRLLIAAEGSAGAGPRLRWWRAELQKLADEIGRPIVVCHLPPGTSKWSTVEHRLSAFIRVDSRGKPSTGHQVTVSLIGAATMHAAPAAPDTDGPSDPEGARKEREPSPPDGNWNYTVLPSAPADGK